MIGFTVKRILLLIPVLFGVAFLVFSILALMPYDAASVQLGMASTPEGIAAWNEAHGLNAPFLQRFFTYLWNLVHGDFGVSWTTNTSIATEFAQRIPTTLTVAAGTMTIIIVIGIPIGVISAVKQYSIFDTVTRVSAMLITAIPIFWLGLLLILVFALKLNWLPATGGGSLKHFIMPCITLSACMAAQLIRMTRSTMLEVIRADFVLTAKAKGAKQSRVVLVHVLRNALLPTITVIGILLGQAVGGAIVTETIFALPGVGTYLLQGINKYDMPVVMLSIIFIAAVICVINIVVDILYMVIDPQLRGQFVRKGKQGEGA